MFQPIQNLYPRALNRLGLGRQAQAAIICEKYRKIAADLIRPDALDHTFPKFYRQKILTIAVANSAWAYTVVTHKRALIESLNASLGSPLIRDIKTRVEKKDPSSV